MSIILIRIYFSQLDGKPQVQIFNRRTQKNQCHAPQRIQIRNQRGNIKKVGSCERSPKKESKHSSAIWISHSPSAQNKSRERVVIPALKKGSHKTTTSRSAYFAQWIASGHQRQVTRKDQKTSWISTSHSFLKDQPKWTHLERNLRQNYKNGRNVCYPQPRGWSTSFLPHGLQILSQNLKRLSISSWVIAPFVRAAQNRASEGPKSDRSYL